MLNRVCIFASGTENWAVDLNNKYGWPISAEKTSEKTLYIKKINGQLAVDYNNLQGICLNFSEPKKLSGSILAKVIGKGRKTIIDATAGLLKDSVKMAYLGHKVLAYEKNPLIYELGKSALENAPDKVKDNIEIIYKDSLSLSVVSPEVIYIDPMFSFKRKKALPKKDMQLFKIIMEVFDESDVKMEAKLLKWATDTLSLIHI